VRKTTKNRSQDNLFTGRELTWRPSKQDATRSGVTFLSTTATL
jgi:hypothetical protein